MWTFEVGTETLIVVGDYALVEDGGTQSWRHRIDAREGVENGLFVGVARTAASPPHPVYGVSDPAEPVTPG